MAKGNGDNPLVKVFSYCVARHGVTLAVVVFSGGMVWNTMNSDIRNAQASSQANTEAIQSLDERLSTIERKQDVQSETLNNIQKSMKEAQDRDRESREDMKRSLDRIFQQLNRNRR